MVRAARRRSAARPLRGDPRIGALIKKARLDAGLTLMALAELVGVSHQQIVKYEQGRTRIAAARLLDVAAALGKPLAHFVGGDDDVERDAARYRWLRSQKGWGIVSKTGRVATGAAVDAMIDAEIGR